MSMESIRLNGTWGLRWQPRRSRAELRHRPTSGAIPVEVPGDVHLALMDAGLIGDPVLGANATQLDWIDKQEWWFTREFASAGDPDAATYLVFDGLDYDADVWVNDRHVGRHRNMFRPLRIDLTGRLRERNRVDVRLLSHEGDLEAIPKDTGLDVRPRKTATMPLETAACRPWMRKAQYTFGWNWTQDLSTCGIWRDVRLEVIDRLALRDAAVRTELPSLERARLTCRCAVQSVLERPTHAALRIEVTPCTEPERVVASTSAAVELAPGRTAHEIQLDLEQPDLWWPAGYGQQARYTARIRVDAANGATCETSVAFGVRRIEIDESPRPDGKGTRFTFLVNGEPIFIKGANWVPADACPARITPAKLEERLRMARELNLNYLRVWGGGIYEGDAFYEGCDELGILIWQDFMFSCAEYPDFDPAFVDEVREEVIYQIERLRNHPCIVMWCGNNELEQLYCHLAFRELRPHHAYYGESLFRELIPGLLRELDPSRPYRSSSGCRGLHDDEAVLPTAPTSGVAHIHIFDALAGRTNPPVASFLGEWYSGAPPSMPTLRDVLPEDAWDWTSPTWKLHDFVSSEFRDKVLQCTQPVDEGLDFVRELHCHHVLQMETYKAAIEWTRRTKWNCSGNVFWMFADAYTGYTRTVIDYYNRRKPSFHPARRAFADVLPIAWVAGETIAFAVVNDHTQEFAGVLEIVACAFDGTVRTRVTQPITAAANAATACAHLPKSDLGPATETVLWMRLRVDGACIAENRFFLTGLYVKDCRIPIADVVVEQETRDGLTTALRVRSDRFVRNFRIEADEDVEISDNWFDLPPGGCRELTLRRPVPAEQLRFTWDNRVFRLEDVLKTPSEPLHCAAGGAQDLGVVLFNPDTEPRTFQVTVETPEGWTATEAGEVTLAAGESRDAALRVFCPPDEAAGVERHLRVRLQHGEHGVAKDLRVGVLPALELLLEPAEDAVAGRLLNRSARTLEGITLVEAWEAADIIEAAHPNITLGPGERHEWRRAADPETAPYSYTVFAETAHQSAFGAEWFRAPDAAAPEAFRPGRPTPPARGGPRVLCHSLTGARIPALRDAPCHHATAREIPEGWSYLGGATADVRLFLHYSPAAFILNAFVEGDKGGPSGPGVPLWTGRSLEIAVAPSAGFGYEACLGLRVEGAGYLLRRLRGHVAEDRRAQGEFFAVMHSRNAALTHFRLVLPWSHVADRLVPEVGMRLRCALAFGTGPGTVVSVFAGIQGRKDPTRYGELVLA
jgi:beta-mannosidase